MNRKEQPGGGYATTFLTGRERIIPLPHAGRGWPDGDDLMYSNNDTSVQSQSERDQTVAGNENGPPSAWREV